MCAKITFSNGTSIELKDGDIVIPIVLYHPGDIGEEPFARQAEAVTLTPHVQMGLIPSIMDVLTRYDFFYVHGNYEIVYGSKSVVTVENV